MVVSNNLLFLDNRGWPIHSEQAVTKAQFWIRFVGVFTLALMISAGGAENQPTAGGSEDTNSLATLRTYLQLQEQIHATQLAIEENRKQANEATARNAESLANRLQAIEQSLATQRSRDIEEVRSSNRLILLVAGTIAALGFVAILLMAFSHWRAMNRLAEIASSLPAGPMMAAPSLPALGSGESRVLALAAPEQVEGRLLGAIDRLEKRLGQLENGPHPPASEVVGSRSDFIETTPVSNGNQEAKDGDGEPAQIGLLLGKGQSLLNLDKPEEALGCFDKILAIAPNHAEALVKKGSALERLRKFDEALGWYDRAIAADPTLTIAYLYKGGIFNRLERFTEALDCYEKALHSQRD